jgi:alpha-mannosidase
MYQEMKDNFPTLYEQAKQRIKEKRWEVIGAFWVEPDCNLVSGESFVRQILHGVDFIEREFGLTPKTAWIPDVFGNAWTMPQILVKSGLKYFVTHKMAFWNDTNKWTKNAFWWQGPDGSRIFATVPSTHFIGTVEPDHLKEHWDGFSEQTTIGETLYAYGWGDGGGGPDPSMLEYAKRYENFPGVVPAKTSTIERCLEQMEQKARQTELPVINDELYLEEHRGVHTTKARLKKLNRYCEILYRKAEMFSCFSEAEYPHANLDKGWKQVLTNQFHDSLPGTHVQRVYQDLLESYELATDIGHRVLRTALENIASRADTQGPGQAVVVFNSQSVTRNSIARLEYPEKQIHVLDGNGSEVPHQFISDFETAKTTLIFPAEDLPPVGYKVYQIVDGKGKKSHQPVKVSPTTLENDYLKVTINDQGEIISLLDKQTNRDSIHPEKHANVMKLYQDIPGTYEAWDIEPRYTDLEFDISAASVEVLEQGPVRSAIQVTRNFLNSRMVQRIVLAATANRLDFETYVDWHEQQKLLKTRFHTNIVTRKATYDIAFGNIKRPTTRNNSYEAAMFEVPAHMWMDLSQADYGLSLLNDCKYGHEAYGDMFSLSLLKGPKWPDPTSDQQEHWFTYSLYPHAQSWRQAKTIQQAFDLNDPVDVFLCDSHQGTLPAEHSFMTVTTDNVILEAVKRAEKSDDLIIRLVERHGSQCQVEVSFDHPIKKASECNLLERQDAPAEYDKQKLSFVARPYEIRTFKIKLI